MDETITWQGYRLLTRERWGSIHPEKPWNWYDPSAITIKNNELHLDIHFNPREFFIDGKAITSNWGIGLVCFEQDFSHGLFEIVAKLPKGHGLWPAFWMYPSDTWPPEIDIFEAYSHTDHYRGWLLKPWQIETCVHREDGLGLKKIPARAPWWCDFDRWFNPFEFNSYSCFWGKTELIFRINGHEVRRITDRGILDCLAAHKMMVIMNNHIDGHYKDRFTVDEDSRPFIIQSFTYKTFNEL